MKIQERYTVARHTSNLKSTAETTYSAADVISAAGMAAQQHEIAMMLWEVAFRGKTSSKLALCDLLEKRLSHEIGVQRWRCDPHRVVREVLAWHLYGTCQPCGGRRYQTIVGTPILSDDICKHCNGTGKVPLTETVAHGWLSDYLGKLTAIAGGQVMHKLNVDMSV